MLNKVRHSKVSHSAPEVVYAGNSGLRTASLDAEPLVMGYQVPDYRIDRSGKKYRSHCENIERKLI